jgi:hypothetical protein
MRTVSNSIVLACALILALPVGQMALAAGAKAEVSHTVVAASGSAAPAGGNYATFTHATGVLNMIALLIRALGWPAADITNWFLRTSHAASSSTP